MLSTAIVLVLDHRNNYIECRTLLDNASTSNYISESFASRLKLPRQYHPISCLGLNQTKTDISEKIHAHVKSRTSKFEFDLDLNIVPLISTALPHSSYDISLWNIPQSMPLADPFFNIARPVDMLIGGERFFELLHSGKFLLGSNRLRLQSSVFGWLCVGSVTEQCHLTVSPNVSSQPNDTKTENNDDLNQTLKQLFEIDHVQDKKHLSKEEEYCESYYLQTVSREESGRYVVSLPLKPNANELGESKTQAVNRFLSLERKLDKNPTFKSEYSDVINDYLVQGHMKPIDDEQKCDSLCYYLPHHAVIKPTSSTTKVRVVFDASAKSSSNISLNDVMHIGPTVQQTCFDIILRFRKHKFVFTSDVNKMYRQVKIDPQQIPLQRILWRENNLDPLKTFELNTVTFGTAAAPYLATRTLKQLALDEGHNFPLASNVVHNDFYVDDVLSGSDDLDTALEMQNQLKSLLASGQFKLHKWSSNSDILLNNIPLDEREILKPNNSSSDDCLKTLGLIWIPKLDVFKFNVPTIDERCLTKRNILSDIAKLYDPLGLLAPVVITAKMLIQTLWKTNLDWDDDIPTSISDTWKTFRTELSSINDIQLPRRILLDNPKHVQLHGFSDASEKGYGACLYVRSIDHDSNVLVQLLCSKSRVAPIKILSLPRLELCAAFLLAGLVKTVMNSIDIDFDDIFLWSDSTITLTWIQTPCHKLKTFVANRVSEIQESTINCTWNHIDTSENPADIISRGVMPSDLSNLAMWWQGPPLLHSPTVNFESNIANFVVKNSEQNDLELKKEVSFATTNLNSDDFDPSFLERFGSYNKMLRSIAYCFRFVKNLRLSKDKRLVGELSNEEIDSALISIVKIIQRKHFSTEIKDLKNGKPIHVKSPILSLNPFLDSSGLLRVGGRLNNADYNFDVKHQMLLPSSSHFTTLVFRHYHLQNLHAGPQLLVSLVRQKFWPMTAKNNAKKCVRSCVPCFKAKPQITQQIMGDLPTDRTTPSRPFKTTGVDLCGPFLLKNKKIRNSSPNKVYVAVFVCFCTKAIHLEILSDLTTDCFLASFKRFIFRRGCPTTMWSDNATNFVGARNELKRWYKMFHDKSFEPLQTFCVSKEINWRFIPPRSPNFGGLWESSVKSLKFHLKRVASNICLSYEELDTLIIQVEGILNSRPLSPLSTDPNDPEPLTPSHFLIGAPILAPPEPDLTEVPNNRLTNWKLLTKLTQHFWQRFSLEYVHTLQQRVKWKSSRPDLKPDDIVLLSDENLPTTQWMLGIVLEVFKGSDDKIRVALVKTKAGNFKRAVSKICKLPIE